jgi:hypothetical protein
MLPGIIGRFVDVAVRQVTIEVPKGISLKERQKQLDLKRQLLRKCLAPVLALFFKVFQPGMRRSHSFTSKVPWHACKRPTDRHSNRKCW